ncbi:proteophosphoglycan-like protein [Thalictrum thalictroides]|uniref:Proteophosphoglycan-like protein n=1 Tax=Thalictrum thalictroides TaxID=46969 RepID=A0A7J6WIX7_THATH|nr:proteophosphoglycan-like protein [Thalictrum thalictroides]
MLVLTRPTPKPLPQLQPQPQSQTKQTLQSSDSIGHHNQSRSEPESDPISLRPLGKTGSSSLTPPPPPPSSSPALITLPQSQESSVISLKPQPFVPPHLRPGFVGKEEKVFGQRNQGLRSRDIVQNDGFNAENGRPKSGGGYERMRRGAESDLEVMNRPSSSGNRPNSSGGWYAGSSSSYRSPSHY